MIPVIYQVVGEEDFGFRVDIDASGDYLISGGTYTSQPPRRGGLSGKQQQALQDAIQALGVEIRTNTPISSDHDIQALFDEDYDAVFVAIGAHKGKKLGIPGEDKYKGVIDAITFLRGVNLGQPEKPGDKVIVIGGGNSAIDSARTTLRVGSEEVHIVYRRSRKEMPAAEVEIEEAEAEGVEIHYLAAPVKILAEKNRVTGMECVKMELGEPDASGRRRPIPIEGSEFVVEADAIIAAISQEPDLTFLPDDHDLEITRWNTFQVDEATLLTSREGVFAGGDAVTGPKTVIDAIAHGHVAARSMDRYLRGQRLAPKAIHSQLREVEIKVDLTRRPKKPRAEMPRLEPKARSRSFDEVDLGFTEAVALAEARRCMRCGPCEECLTCVPECRKRVTLMQMPDGQGDLLLRLPPEFDSSDLRYDYESGLLFAGGSSGLGS